MSVLESVCRSPMTWSSTAGPDRVGKAVRFLVLLREDGSFFSSFSENCSLPPGFYLSGHKGSQGKSSAMGGPRWQCNIRNRVIVNDFTSWGFISFWPELWSPDVSQLSATPWPGEGQLRVLGWAAGMITRAAQSLCASPAAWDRDSWICTDIELQSRVEALQWFIVLGLEIQLWRDTEGAIFKRMKETLVYYRVCPLSLGELHATGWSMCCSPLKYFYSVFSTVGDFQMCFPAGWLACCSAVSEHEISCLASWVHLIRGWLFDTHFGGSHLSLYKKSKQFLELWWASPACVLLYTASVSFFQSHGSLLPVLW